MTGAALTALRGTVIMLLPAGVGDCSFILIGAVILSRVELGIF